MEYRIQPDETLDQKIEKFDLWLSMLYPPKRNGPREKHVAIVRSILECFPKPTTSDLRSYLAKHEKPAQHIVRRAWFDYYEHRADIGEYVAKMPD